MSSGNALVSFCPLSIEFVNAYVQNYCRLRLLLLALGTRAYAESSPITADDASCFSASWPSISASTADFPWYMFSEAAILSESRGSHCDCRICAYSRLRERREGAYARDKLNIRANAPSPLLSKIVCKKGGRIFRSLR